MSAAHKKALADGRRMSKTVDTYIRAIQTPNARGRKVSAAQIKSRLEEARQKVTTETGVNMLLAVQAVRDLDVKLHTRTNGNSETARKQATAAFIKIAAAFSKSRNISYASWRDIGVPASVLKQAGIARTRES